MGNEIVKQAFDYGVVPEENRDLVKAKTVETKILVRQTAHGIIEIGKNLIEVKNAIGHGNWLPWLDAEFGFSDKTAQKYMNVSSKFELSSNLNIAPSALYMLAQNSTPEEVRQEAIEMAESGETPTAKEVKELNQIDDKGDL